MSLQTPTTSINTVLSDEERSFSEDHRVAHLATADASGAPHVIPICYAVVGNAFYFIVDEKPKRTRTGLKRLRNIAANPRVALVIDDYDEDWRRLAYLLVRGRAAVVADQAEYTAVLGALRERYPQYRAMPLASATHPMVRIVPEHRHLWRAAAGT
ncbi:MAG TPA: TIGR03668 family PPOX class F420-dependent oxidoreductase [Candidatus Margulisiibacteriota bacterium]|nr:TIGR03668 family PPOX class F420-dependent oxidoreductase [Candidatus Margulisiibacteriota bacterium]